MPSEARFNAPAPGAADRFIKKRLVMGGEVGIGPVGLDQQVGGGPGTKAVFPIGKQQAGTWVLPSAGTTLHSTLTSATSRKNVRVSRSAR